MAENKSAEQNRIAELEAALARSTAQNATLTETNTALAEAVKDMPVALPIAGTFTAKVRRGAESKELKFGFKKGHRQFRDEKATIFMSELVMKVATGTALSDTEKTDYPSIVSLTKESAQALLQRLADLNYSGLEEVQ
jgi:hypothetical protein